MVRDDSANQTPTSLTDALEKLAAGADPSCLTPLAWATLNKELKEADTKKPKGCIKNTDKNAKKPKRKIGKKKIKTKKSAKHSKRTIDKEEVKIDFKTFLKREHSKVYHATVKEHKGAGFDSSIAKKKAREAACRRQDELRLLRSAGKFNEYA